MCSKFPLTLQDKNTGSLDGCTLQTWFPVLEKLISGLAVKDVCVSTGRERS